MGLHYRILLINPWIYDFAAVNMWARPLGVLKVAELLSGYNVSLQLIDCMDTFRLTTYNKGRYPKQILPVPEPLRPIKRRYGRYGITEEEFLHKLKHMPTPDVVLITGIMTYWYPGVRRAIELCREYLRDQQIILGGIYPSLLPEHARKTSGADIIYRGRLSNRLLQLLQDMGLQLTPSNSGRPYYRLGFYKSLPYAPVLTSEGCPFSCSYCASGILNNHFYQRSTDEVFKEIQELVELGVRDLAFYDDALLFHPEEHIKPLLKKVASFVESIPSNRRPRFHTPNGLHARFLDRELAVLMRRANFKTIRLSLETTNRLRQVKTGAKVFNEELKQAVAYLKEAGFTKNEIGVYLMYGLPEQEIEEVWEGVYFLISTGVRIYLAEYSPIPGTKDWEYLIDRGIISRDMDPLLTNNSVFAILLAGYNEEEIQRLKRFVLEYNRT